MSNLVQMKDQEIDANVLATLKNSIYPGAKDESIAMAISYCKAAGLDPLLKPVHIVPMSVKNSETGSSNYRDVVMPGIGLYRIQAARSNQYAGVSEPEFGETIIEDLDGVTVSYPLWCKVVVKKIVCGNIVEFAAKEYWKENYAAAGKENGRKLTSPNAMWQKRPFAQLAKCAEAQALRKAFPEFISHQPTAEEMEGKVLNEFEPKDLTSSVQANTALKEEAKEKVQLDAAIVKEFMQLCKESSLDVKAFAKFAGVDRAKIETVKNAIANFHSLKEAFLEVEHASA